MNRSIAALSIFAAFAISACGDSSGLNSDDVVGSMSERDRRTLCEWLADKWAPDGEIPACGSGSGTPKATYIDDCIADSYFASCSVEDWEECAKATEEDFCAVTAATACAGARACYDGLMHCGDGTLDDPESCDDGNGAAGDGCDAVCEIEQGYPGGSCDPVGACNAGASCLVNICIADGTLAAGSTCSHDQQCVSGSCGTNPFVCN